MALTAVQSTDALLQAAQSSNGLCKLAVSVTRPTEQDLAQILSPKSCSAVKWHEGCISAAVVNQVNKYNNCCFFFDAP